MKKVILFAFTVQLAFILAGCGKQNGQTLEKPTGVNPSREKAQKPVPKDNQLADSETNPDLQGWQDYTNPKNGYRVKYPADWFYLEDACCPPPPAYVNFNNISTKMSELGEAQATKGTTDSIDILCIYEAALDQIGEVQSFKDEGAKNEPVQINGFPGIKITNPAGPDSDLNVLTYYLSNPETSSCRITFRDSCQECGNILQTFTYFK